MIYVDKCLDMSRHFSIALLLINVFLFNFSKIVFIFYLNLNKKYDFILTKVLKYDIII